MADEKKPIKIFGNPELSNRVSMFQQKAEEHKQKQKLNPFSSSYDRVEAAKQRLNRQDSDYGKPVEGSKTEERGRKAQKLLHDEIKLLCRIIDKHGVLNDDGTKTITFGELFNLYMTISNKLVGILLRARKYHLVQFEGEMLFQRQDDHVVITLLRMPQEEEVFG